MPAPTGIVQNVADLYGRYHLQNKNQQLYHFSTAVASAVTLTTAGSTTQTFGLWNPLGYPFDLSVRQLIVSIQGTGTQADLVWAVGYTLGANIGTAAPVPTGTIGKPVPGYTLVQAPGASGAMPITAFTLTTAPSLLRHIPIGWGAPGTNTAAIYNGMVDLPDGDIIVGPGTMVMVAATAAPGVTANLTISWVETPK